MEIKITKESKNSIDLRIKGITHGVMNSIRYRLNNINGVILATYSVPHPLLEGMTMHIETTGQLKPMDAFKKAVKEIETELRVFDKAWKNAV